MNRNAFRVPMKQPGGGMPQYNPQQLPAAPGADVSARLSDSAGQIVSQGADQQAKGLDALGKGMQQATKAGYDLYHDYQTTQAKEAWLTYKQEAARKQADLDTQLQGKDAMDPENGVMAQMKKWREQTRQELAKKLGGPAAGMFDNAAADTDASMDAWAVRKVHQEGINYGNAIGKARMAEAHQSALAVANDPEAFAAQMGVIMAETEAMAKRNGYDQEWSTATFNGVQREILVQAVRDSIKGEQLGQADSIMKKWGPLLGSAAGGLRAEAAAKGRELQSRAEAQVKKAEDARVKAEFDGFYSLIKDSPAEEQIVAVEEKYGKDPKLMAEALDALAFRAGARKNIENKKDALRMNEIEGSLTKALSLPPDQQLQETEGIITSLPLDLRPKARQMLTSLSAEASGDGRPSNPVALREVTHRLANGEEFNIRSEYGEYLSPTDINKLVTGQKDGLQKKIRPMFIMELNRWKTGNAKTHEDVYGKNSSAATLFSSFMQSLPEGVAEDPRRLKEAMTDFFKTDKLNSGAAILGGDREVPRGMTADFMSTYKTPYPVIERDSDMYGMATAALKAKNIAPAGMNKKYTDRQIAEAMREIITQRPELRGLGDIGGEHE